MSARYFGLNSTFLVSYRPQASVLAPIFWSNMLPVAFILYCALKHSKRMALYTESVLFPTFAQALMTIPNASYLTWFALFIGQNTPTTVFFCTSPKIIASSFTLMSFSTIAVILVEIIEKPIIQALSLSRFITIVFGIKTGLRFTVIISIIIAMPLVAVVFLIHFDGFLYPANDACQPILFLKFEHLPVYHFYCFAVPTLAVLFNLLTLTYLLQYKFRKAKQASKSSFDELYVALSLFVQSFSPLFTVGARAVISLNVVNQYGITIPVEVTKAIDMLGCFTVGINALVAILLLKSFRNILLDLLPFCPRETINTQVSFTSTIAR